MKDPMQAILELRSKAALFPVNSRYHGIDSATLKTAEGKTITYIRRRFVPPPERFHVIREHTVSEGERLDNIAATYLGDPEQFWQLCDANGAVHPDELTDSAGRRLRITLPEGMPGSEND